MSLDFSLWLAMGAAAFFYHHALGRGKPPALFMLVSVAVSVLAMVVFPREWLAILLGQLLLFGAIFAYARFRR